MSKKSPAAATGNTRGGRSSAYSALKIDQNGHAIFFTTIPIGELFDYCVVERRSENPTEGFQRRLSEPRADEIAEYLNTEANSIPINILLSAQPEAEFTYRRENKAISFLRVPGAFVILDGQHRMWGYHKCAARHRVPVATYEGLARPDEARLFVDINTKHQGVPKALILDVKGLAGSESEDEQLVRELFDRLNTDEESPLRNKLSAAQSSSGKLSRVAFNTSVGRAVKRDTLRRITSKEKQYELIVKYLRAFHEELEDKPLLTKKHYFNSVFELFDEVVKKTKKDSGSVTLDSLRQVVGSICNPPEESLPKVQKRDTLVEIMRSRLNSDTSISDEDI